MWLFASISAAARLFGPYPGCSAEVPLCHFALGAMEEGFLWWAPMTPLPVCSMSRDKGRAPKKSIYGRGKKELAVPRLLVADDCKLFFVYEQCHPPLPAVPSSLPSPQLITIVTDCDQHPSLGPPAPQPYPRKPKSETTTPVHHTHPILLCFACPASQATALYRSSLERPTRLVWASCRTHHAPVAGKTPGGRGVPSAGQSLHLASAVSRPRTKLLHIAPQPHSAGLRLLPVRPA